MKERSKPGSMAVMPYLFFGGRCEEALEFYGKVLGAKVEMMMRFSQSPVPVPVKPLQEGFGNKIMHASFVIRGTTIMASDGCDDKSVFSGFSLALHLPDEAEARRIFPLLSEGGSVAMPLAETFWSPCYGMLVDRFGINWMVMVPATSA
jgi:PhnB protein